MAYLTLVPAYGDYKSQKAVKEAWDAGKDFRIASITHPDDGRYINKHDAEKLAPNTTFNIRYKNLTQICQIKPTKAKKAREDREDAHYRDGW